MPEPSWKDGNKSVQAAVAARRRAPAHAAGPVPPLSALAPQGVREILIWCGNSHQCWHRGVLALDALDQSQTIVELKARLVCTRCGFVGGGAMPNWPGRSKPIPPARS